MEKSVLVYHLSGGLRVLVVAFHHVEATAAHLSLNADRTFLARFGVEHLDLHKRIVASHGGATLFEGVVEASLCHSRRRLGESVDRCDGEEHLFRGAFHQFHGAEAASHDARAQASEVEHIEHGVVELCYEHRRDTIDGGAAFFMYGGEYH